MCAEAVWGPRAGDGDGVPRREADLRFQSEAFVHGDGCAGVQIQLRGDDAKGRRCERRGVRAPTAACRDSDRLSTGAHLVIGIYAHVASLHLVTILFYCSIRVLLYCTSFGVFE